MHVWKLTLGNDVDGTFDGTIPLQAVPGGFPGLVTDMKTEPDGRILIAAYPALGGISPPWLIAARLQASGVLDTTFGDGGIFVQDFTPLSPTDLTFPVLERQGFVARLLP